MTTHEEENEVKMTSRSERGNSGRFRGVAMKLHYMFSDLEDYFIAAFEKKNIPSSIATAFPELSSGSTSAARRG